MTLEELQEKYLEVCEENRTLKDEKETLSQDNETLKQQCEDLRTQNQRYYNKLIAQELPGTHTDDEEQDEDVLSCEDFAKDLDI